MKHRIVHTLQKYVLNPPIQVAFCGGAAAARICVARNEKTKDREATGLRIGWNNGTAHLLPDDDPRERQRWLANPLPFSAGNARAVRLFGTQLLSIRIDLDS